MSAQSNPSLTEPDPIFLEHLAWQTRTALRRASRFAAPTRAPHLAALRTAVLVLLSLAGGAASVVAAEHLVERRAAELLLAAAEIRVETAALRAANAGEELARQTALAAAGVVAPGTVAAAEAELARRAAERDRLALDVTEIAATGRAPRADLGAPLVDGRDLVAERLELELGPARVEEARARAALERESALAERGFASDTEASAARLAAGAATRTLTTLERRLELRRAFLRGELGAVEAEVRGLVADADARSAAASARAEHLETRRARLALLVEAGVASTTELRELEAELAAATADRRLAELERATLAARLGR